MSDLDPAVVERRLDRIEAILRDHRLHEPDCPQRDVQKHNAQGRTYALPRDWTEMGEENFRSSGYEPDHVHRWVHSYPGTNHRRIHCEVVNCQTSIEEPNDDDLPGMCSYSDFTGGETDV